MLAAERAGFRVLAAARREPEGASEPASRRRKRKQEVGSTCVCVRARERALAPLADPYDLLGPGNGGWREPVCRRGVGGSPVRASSGAPGYVPGCRGRESALWRLLIGSPLQLSAGREGGSWQWRGHWEPRTLPPPRGVVLGEMPGILQKTALPLLPKVPVRKRNLQRVKRLEEARENVHLLHLLKRPERLLN